MKAISTLKKLSERENWDCTMNILSQDWIKEGILNKLLFINLLNKISYKIKKESYMIQKKIKIYMFTQNLELESLHSQFPEG
jgi:hypothetical protein